MKKNTKQLLEDIDQVIDWYFANSNSASVDDLIYNQDKLATYSWNLAELSGETKEDYTFKYFIRKINVNKTAQSLTKQMAMNKALSQSELLNEQHLKAEIEAEGAAYTADIKLKQVNKILQVMQQRISYAKKLWELNRFVTPTETVLDGKGPDFNSFAGMDFENED